LFRYDDDGMSWDWACWVYTVIVGRGVGKCFINGIRFQHMRLNKSVLEMYQDIPMLETRRLIDVMAMTGAD
jgi:hypothetical protein